MIFTVTGGTTAPAMDPGKGVLFSFYNDQLSRMVIDYDRERTADNQAIQSDEREAPAREIARQKKEADDALASQEKARVANKAAFRP